MAEWSEPALAPETRLMRALYTASGDAEAALARRMHMHPTDLAAMDQLAFSTRPLGPSELAGRIGLSPAATTEVVDRLERAGHLVRRRDDADRRRVHLDPTPSAVGAVLGRIAGLLEGLDGLVEGMPDEDRAAVRRYLEGAVEVYRRWSTDAPED